MRYVVTGAAGFIGSHLGHALLASGHDVVAIDSFEPYYDLARKEANAEGLDVVRADLATDELDDLVRGADGIFHLAAQPGVRSFGDVFDVYVRNNVLASRRVFEAAAAAGARVLFASSSSIYGEAETYPTPEDARPLPVSPYGITKLAAEHLARAYARSFGLDAVTLRLSTVYGPRQRPDMAFQRIVEALATRRPFELYGDGGQSRSFTYVADAVDAALRAMDAASAGAVYNVAGGAEATLRDAIDVLERVAGRALELRAEQGAAGDVRRIAADTTRIERELGWRAQTPLEAGLQAQWEWASATVAAG